MPRPLKVKYNGLAFDGIQEMSDSEIDTVADLILDEFTDNVGTGHLAMNTQSGWTAIGTFVDTRRDQAEGTHPANTTINSDNYVFRQNLTAISPSTSTRPLGVKYSGSDMVGVQEMTDSHIVTYIINRVQEKLIVFSPGTYKLQPSAPSGGTWTSIATVYDKHQSHTEDTTYLWHRTDNPSSGVVRPIKSSSLKDFKELTDTEIKSLTDYFRNEINQTGIGKYELSASSPSSGGTWVQAGSGFDDTRHERTDVGYSGSYDGTYTGYYAGSRTYSADYAGAYAGAYTGYFTGYYAGSRTYSGAYSGNYQGGYVGYFTGSYTGYYSTAYTGYYTGAYIRYFSGSVGGFYDGTYTGYYSTAYSGSYSGNYGRTFTGTYTGYYSGSRTYSTDYAGNYGTNFLGYYTGYYAGSRTYSTNYAGGYTGTYTGSYTGATIMSSLETISNLNLWLRTA
jgi:hypothetical protein